MTTTQTDAPSAADGNESIEDRQTVPAPIRNLPVLPGGFEFQGYLAEPDRMARETPEPDGPLFYWRRDDNTMVGVCKADTWAADGYPYLALKLVAPIDGPQYWTHTHIAASWSGAVYEAANTADHCAFLAAAYWPETTYWEWVEATGGTAFTNWTGPTDPSDPITIDESNDATPTRPWS